MIDVWDAKLIRIQKFKTRKKKDKGWEHGRRIFLKFELCNTLGTNKNITAISKWVNENVVVNEGVCYKQPRLISLANGSFYQYVLMKFKRIAEYFNESKSFQFSFVMKNRTILEIHACSNPSPILNHARDHIFQT